MAILVRRHGASAHHAEQRGSGTILAVSLALVVLLTMALILLLAQAAVMASRAATAADLAALAGADALRGITTGVPCVVAADVASRHGAVMTSCHLGPEQSVDVRTSTIQSSLVGPATGHSRAGPPP
ncbi:hypothetical protein PSET11_01347 [Arthrobacter ulcerisalmonis]|uniref:Uncharacterized protein n=1 Tax=Arthrobacter ulcerisalmonis TaxID=2483813 RepID=A0A3P5XAI2_9MICC|nr:Rv3654c family TadE-like protein [Arthrobacter ulcerisalmonis]VDC24464.1 hypothetical protein PSET11_01347 [Arthrobacter ulcerisalmonis]